MFLNPSLGLILSKTPTSLILPAMLKSTCWSVTDCIDWCRITITHAARPDSYKQIMQPTCTLCSQYQSCFLFPFTWLILRLITFRSPHSSTITLACIHLRDRWTTKTTTSNRTACVGEAPVTLPSSQNPQNLFVAVSPVYSGWKSFPVGSPKSRKGPVSFFMSVRPFVLIYQLYVMYQFDCHWTSIIYTEALLPFGCNAPRSYYSSHYCVLVD